MRGRVCGIRGCYGTPGLGAICTYRSPGLTGCLGLIPGKYVRGDALEEQEYALDEYVPEQGGD